MVRSTSHKEGFLITGAITPGTVIGHSIAQGALNPDRTTNPQFVEEGASVSHIRVHFTPILWIDTATANLPGLLLDFYIAFKGAKDADADMPTPGQVNFHPLRDQVLYQNHSFLFVNNSTVAAITLVPKMFDIELNIPRVYQELLVDDAIVVRYVYTLLDALGNPAGTKFGNKFMHIFEELRP